MEITAEQLTYWYLRLNGFLTIQNFIIHPDTGRNQRTDADILGVRFPYRAELKPNTMMDEPLFSRLKDKPYIMIAEVKTGLCMLNGPWTRSEDANLQRVLRAVGVLPETEIEHAAQDIYNTGAFSTAQVLISLCCFGKYKNPLIKDNFPKVPQILWEDVLSFIFMRFKKYKNHKVSHGQWNDEGQNLWRAYETSKNELDSFIASISIVGGPIQGDLSIANV